MLDSHRIITESLEGRFHSLEGRDVAQALADFAKEYGITQLVLGENSNPTWRDFFRLSIIQRLIYLTHDIDIHIMDRRVEER